MHLLRLFVYGFGGLFLLYVIALGRQIGREHLSKQARAITLRGSIEGWLLFGAALVVAVRYGSELVDAADMPGIDGIWVITYSSCCGAYLGVKAIRMSLIHG